MTWDDLRVFLAVQRAGSHARAGRTLRVAATTVGRRVAALEAALGARLFRRTPAGLEATAAGARLAARAERVEAELLAAEREVAGADSSVAGPLRLTASDGVAGHVLIPALAALRRAHPELVLELRLEARPLDLSRREADVAVRLARPREPALVARRLGTLQFGLHASRGYLARRALPRSARDLSAHDFVGADPALDSLPQARWLRAAVPGLRFGVRASTTLAQAQLCADGHGLALLPLVVAADDPRLERVLPGLGGPTREVWAVTHGDLRRNARVGCVLDWLATLDWAAGLTGPGGGQRRRASR